MIERRQRLAKLALGFGSLGLLGMLFGVMVALAGYNTAGSGAFNFSNHTMSELGNYGHSPLAVALNGGLFFGSLCLVLFCLYSMQLSRSLTGVLCFLTLAFACMSLAGVGLFPVNVYHLHVLMIKWFFLLGCVSALLYMVHCMVHCAFSCHWRGMHWSIVPALASCVGQGAFLLLPYLQLNFTEGNRPFYQEMVLEVSRPSLWWPAVLQWGCLAMFVLWILALLLEHFSRFRQDPAAS